jgi:hypothetical protein
MAYNGIHRSVTAGVALAGAGAIAFATLPVLPADEIVAAPPALSAPAAAPRVVTTEIDPVVFAQALEILANGALAAVQQSVDGLTVDVPAIWNQIVEQWPDVNLTPWNHSLVATSLLAPIAPLVVGPFNDAVAEVVARVLPQFGDEIRVGLPAAIEYAFARLVGPFLSAFGATGAVHQDYYHAGMAGDRLGQNLALLTSPIKVIDGFLWGGYGDLAPLFGDPGDPRIAAPGLLTPWGQWPVDRNVTVAEDDLPGNALTLAVEAGATEETAPETETVATEEVSPVVETAAESEEVVAEPIETAHAVDTADDKIEVEPVNTETEADEPKASRLSLRQSIADLRDSVKKLTGAGREEASDEADKTDEADKNDTADTTDSSQATSEKSDARQGDTE